ncbi:thiolase family protein [Natrinema salsiterrestre]|uniref:Thiolase family protein n=1 Tax=Natrinema salsiterrestre TaxID=2950540 RepID=A0A9Q4Q097_9EURY|nr:thiolase family protein [Natrinema salsiterrestre]MDF9746220.1 thiolase family protein [Natrinema salsiterrestre]
MPDTTTPAVAGIGTVPNGTHSVPERDLALRVVRDALEDASLELSTVDGLYMPAPRPWTPQGFFSTYLLHVLGLEVDRSLEVSTGGTSGGNAFHSAVSDIRDGTVETALVLAVERNSIVETTGPYFDYILKSFDAEFESPIGMTVPAAYAQSMQRYAYEYGIDRGDLADIVVKNRENGAANPNGLFDESPSRDDVLDARLIADPIRLFDCPAPCDGAAAILLTADDVDESSSPQIAVDGTGYHHTASHFLMSRETSITELPAVRRAANTATDRAGVSIADIDVFEPYAPFPHIEAIVTEELGLAERGRGVDACLEDHTAPDGPFPISPSGGCLGRGHPPMVTPLLNYVEAVKQLRGTASTQVPDAGRVLTTAEHGHVNGVTATVFATEV